MALGDARNINNFSTPQNRSLMNAIFISGKGIKMPYLCIFYK
jgi:hypothetical protein